MLVSGVALSQPMGGVRRHNMELLPRVGERLAASGGLLAILEGRDGIPFPLPECIERIPSSVPARHPALRALHESRALERLARESAASGTPYDFIHTAHFPAPRSLSVPMSVTVHDLRSFDLEHTPISRRLLARGFVGPALERAARVFTVSESVRTSLANHWPVTQDKTFVVPNAPDHFEPLPRSASADAPILHIGHLEKRKNVQLLIEALALDETLPDVLLAGAPKHGEDERLSALASQFGVRERVHFHGAFADEELPRLYANAACVVLPSHLEGFGIAVLEAQRARVPLAVSTAGALTEVAGTGVPSFAPNDAAACATAIHAALARSSADIDSDASAAQRFTWDASADAWVAGWSS